jgi:hypothetical protein
MIFWRASLASLVAALPLAALAQAPAPAPGPAPTPSATAEPAPARPSLRLDSILQPRSLPAAKSEEARGGQTRQEWADAFAAARREIGDLEKKVEVSRQKLSDSSEGSEYQYSPLGGGAATDPETLKLRAQLKRDRESLDAARRRLRDLEVEASLSGVPREWFDSKENSASP